MKQFAPKFWVSYFHVIHKIQQAINISLKAYGYN